MTCMCRVMLVIHIHICNLGEKGGGSVAMTYRIGILY